MDVGARFRAAAAYATSQGFVGGFLNFFQADYGSGTVFGTILLPAAAAEWRDVPAAVLGNPPENDVGGRFRAVNAYATSQGFVGGFPNFYQADYGSGTVYGTILLRAGAAEWRDVNQNDLISTTGLYGAIRDHWMTLGGAGGFLGFPLTPEAGTADGVGRFNLFEGGVIYWTPFTGAKEVHGAILDKWIQLGSETSYLGYPTSDELDWADHISSRISFFQRGSIAWMPFSGAFDLPETIVLESGTIAADDPSGVFGWATLIFNSAGFILYKGHIHNPDVIGYDVAMASVLRFQDAKGQVVAVGDTGHVDGTEELGGLIGNRDHDWEHSPAFSQVIRDNFDALRSVGMHTVLKYNVGVADVIAAAVEGIFLIVAAIVGPIFFNKNYKICGPVVSRGQPLDPSDPTGPSQAVFSVSFVPKGQDCPPSNIPPP